MRQLPSSLVEPRHLHPGPTGRWNLPQRPASTKRNSVIKSPRNACTKIHISGQGDDQPIRERESLQPAAGGDERQRTPIWGKEARVRAFRPAKGNGLELIEAANENLPNAIDHTDKRHVCPVWREGHRLTSTNVELDTSGQIQLETYHGPRWRHVWRPHHT